MSDATAIHSVAHPADGQHNEDALVHQRQRDVLLDNAKRALAQAKRDGKFGQVVSHQRDIGSFQSDIRACRTHRDAYRGGRESRRVVHAVANKHHPVTRRLDLADGPHLVIREQPRVVLGNAKLLRNGTSGPLVVSRQHHDTLNAARSERLNRFFRVWPHPITYGDNSDWIVRCAGHNGGSAVRFEATQRRFRRGSTQPALTTEPLVAKVQHAAFHKALHTATDQRLKVSDRRER